MEFIKDLVNSSTFYYILIGIAYFLCIVIVVTLLVKNKRKKYASQKVEPKKDLESVDLELVLAKMQAEVSKPKDEVMTFEEEQEEKAIISYQELVDNVKAGKIEVIDDEESNTNFVESLNIQETVEPINTVVEESSSVTPEMVKEAIENISTSSIKEEPKKFKNSAFISPIYGVMNENLEYPKVKKSENILDIMNTKDYNELTEEIKRQEEFLNALKEFRNNL